MWICVPTSGVQAMLTLTLTLTFMSDTYAARTKAGFIEPTFKPGPEHAMGMTMSQTDQ